MSSCTCKAEGIELGERRCGYCTDQILIECGKTQRALKKENQRLRERVGAFERLLYEFAKDSAEQPQQWWTNRRGAALFIIEYLRAGGVLVPGALNVLCEDHSS